MEGCRELSSQENTVVRKGREESGGGEGKEGDGRGGRNNPMLICLSNNCSGASTRGSMSQTTIEEPKQFHK